MVLVTHAIRVSQHHADREGSHVQWQPHLSIRAGKISETLQLYDVAGFLRQIGALTF